MTTAELVREVLSMLDQRQDGTLDLGEMRAVMLEHSDLSERDFELLFNECDVNKSGRVDFVNFVDVILGSEAPSPMPLSPGSPGPSRLRELRGAARLGALRPPEVKIMSPTGERKRNNMLTPGANEAAAAKLQTVREAVHQHAQHVTETSAPGYHAEWAMPVKLDCSVLSQMQELEHGNVQAEYVWLQPKFWDGRSFELGSRALTLEKEPASVTDSPIFSFVAEESDVHLVPRRKYRDPFRRGGGILILADTYEEPAARSGKAHGAPTGFNTRVSCEEIMAKAVAIGEEPWFGMVQDYVLMDPFAWWPLGWPKNGGFPGAHDDYYCTTGAHKTAGRDIAECHYRACLHAGVCIAGMNSEKVPGMWSFQVGPCAGVQAADDLWMARYILQRVCEMFQVGITFDPKPVPGWSGQGCSTSYSTNATRSHQGGMEAINAQIDKLQKRHTEHIAVYGKGNNRRLTGTHNTLAVGEFGRSTGRNTSIRVSAQVEALGYGPYEDRRPAANSDPYVVTKMLVESTLFPPSYQDTPQAPLME